MYKIHSNELHLIICILHSIILEIALWQQRSCITIIKYVTRTDICHFLEVTRIKLIVQNSVEVFIGLAVQSCNKN